MTDHDPDVHEQRVANEQPDGMAPLRTLDGQTIYELPYRREGSTVHLGWSTSTELAEVRAAAERAAARDLYSRMELGKTQRGLAASQADLTRVEAERDRANSQVEVELIKLANVRELWGEERAELERERQESGRLRRELEQLREDVLQRNLALDSAHEELNAARAWRVARQDAGDCARCGQLITRGYAVEPMPGTTKGTWQHSQCPETEGL